MNKIPTEISLISYLYSKFMDFMVLDCAEVCKNYLLNVNMVYRLDG